MPIAKRSEKEHWHVTVQMSCNQKRYLDRSSIYIYCHMKGVVTCNFTECPKRRLYYRYDLQREVRKMFRSDDKAQLYKLYDQCGRMMDMARITMLRRERVEKMIEETGQ